MKTAPVTTSTATIWLEDGVLHAVAKPGATETLETAKEVAETTKELAGGLRRPMLLDIRGARALKRPARQLHSSPESDDPVCAIAIIVKGGISRAIANFILGVAKPDRPTRLFTSESEALAWLEQYLPTQEEQAHER